MNIRCKKRRISRILTVLLAAALIPLAGKSAATPQTMSQTDNAALYRSTGESNGSKPSSDTVTVAGETSTNLSISPSADAPENIVKGASATLQLKTTAVTDSAISLTWNTVDGATGYNVYNGNAKLNREPVTDPFYCAIGLTANTYYSFSVTAVRDNTQLMKSDPLSVATDAAPITGDTLASAATNTLNMEYSELALSLEYVGTAMSDPEYSYWCIAPIDDDDGKTHLFVSRWKSLQQPGAGIEGWKTICEIAHCVGDSPEGPFTVTDIALSNDTMPKGQFAPHNIRAKKIDGVYCLLYITQGSDQQKDQKVCLATSDSLYGPWELQGENKDGVVVQASKTGWTAGSFLGTDNPDIIKIKDEYFIYFKAGKDFSSAHYGYAVSDHLTYGYVKSEDPITDNLTYIEDTTAFEMDGKIYLLTTDNFGGNTGIRGAGILWESEDGRSFKLADAKIGFGLLSDYMAIPPNATPAYVGEPKFERPAVLMRDGKPAYFYAACGLNVDEFYSTQNFVLKVVDRESNSTLPRKVAVHFNGGGSTGGAMADDTVARGSTYTIPSNTFVKDGYTFAGWKADGAVVGTYADGDRVKYILDDITLTAQWVKDEK